MDEEEYQAQLAALREQWGGIVVDRGFVRSERDPTAGFLVGMRAPLIAEIINRALEQGE